MRTHPQEENPRPTRTTTATKDVLHGAWSITKVAWGRTDKDVTDVLLLALIVGAVAGLYLGARVNWALMPLVTSGYPLTLLLVSSLGGRHKHLKKLQEDAQTAKRLGASKGLLVTLRDAKVDTVTKTPTGVLVSLTYSDASAVEQGDDAQETTGRREKMVLPQRVTFPIEDATPETVTALSFLNILQEAGEAEFYLINNDDMHEQGRRGNVTLTFPSWEGSYR